MKRQVPSFLDGDGRMMVAPNGTFALPGTRSISIRRATARTLYEKLLSSGDSMHSASGGTLWAIIRACHETKVRYELHVWPGEAIYIKVIR